MTSGSNEQDQGQGTNEDQDAQPPTPDGREPDAEQLRPGSEPASDPDPEPGGAASDD